MIDEHEPVEKANDPKLYEAAAAPPNLLRTFLEAVLGSNRCGVVICIVANFKP